jgi:hypothetical protein
MATAGSPLTLVADGANLTGVNAVEFLIDDMLVGSADQAPFSIAHVLDSASPSQVSLRARAVLGGTNLAATAVLTASPQTYAHAFVPERATDGNTDPDITHGSVAVVVGDPLAWWQADLGEVKTVQTINVHLMTGCCETSNRFAVLVADTPFVADDFAAGTLPQTFSNGAQKIYQTPGAYDQSVVVINVQTNGRFIRIINLENQYLALAEVEIIEPRTTAESAAVQVLVQP